MFNDILDSIINNASPDEIEIIRNKLNNHLINHLYDEDIHKELVEESNSSTCPHCGGHHIIKYGKDNHHNQRYQCKDCLKTFSSVTGTLLSYTKKDSYTWYLYLDSLFHGDTLKVSAQIANICEYTAFVWRHKILDVLAKLTDDDPVLSDTVWLDEKLVNTACPGVFNSKPSIKKHGISDQKRNIACAIDEHHHTVIQVAEKGRIHSDSLTSIFKDKIPSNCTVISDSLRSYHKFMDDIGVTWIKIPSGKTSYMGNDLQRINELHSSIALFLDKYRGIADHYLKNYIGLYKYKDRHNYIHMPNVFKNIFKEIVNSECKVHYEDIGTSFNMC